MGRAILYTSPSDADLVFLAENMRRQDVEELEVSTYLPVLEALYAAVRCSDERFLLAAHVDGKLLCVFGCSTLGEPWLLGTDLLNGYTLSLTKAARAHCREWLAVYPVLANWIDVRQARVIEFLRLVGFEFFQLGEFKPGFPVQYFEMRAN